MSKLRFSNVFYVILKFTKWPKRSGITLKNMAFFEGNQLFAGDFYAVLDETNTDTVQGITRSTGNTKVLEGTTRSTQGITK